MEDSKTKYEEVANLLPRLHRYLSLDSAEEGLLDTLKEIFPDSEMELNPQNQQMLYNLGQWSVY